MTQYYDRLRTYVDYIKVVDHFIKVDLNVLISSQQLGLQITFIRVKYIDYIKTLDSADLI